MSFHFSLITPERTLVEVDDASSLALPTAEGEITVLSNHMPLSSLLVAGILRYRRAEGSEEEVAVSQGFIRVAAGGTVTVLAETAERGDELDLQTIADAQDRARRIMQQTVSADDASFALAASALQRELARHKLAIKHRHKQK